MVEKKRPAEPVRDAQGYELKTLAELARHLNECFPPKEGYEPVSRQLLHKARKSPRISFPRSVPPAGGVVRGVGHDMFRVNEVVEWYKIHRPYRINTTPSSSSEENGEGNALAA